ncbi:MAG: hypothetical protein Q7S39_00695 [Ignavibacteria bacterium]|nr:hypothetical protein [Ignavibacteria bacterium]
MKTYFHISLLTLFFSIFFLSGLAFAQQQIQNLGNVFHVNKQQFSFPANGSIGELDSLIKVYTDKVIKKNEYILSYKIIVHWYGHDNRDFIAITEAKNWEDIPKVDERNTELFNEAWKTPKEREAYNKARNKYFTGIHSDEIYHEVLNGTK